MYPGGSFYDPAARGYHWEHDYWCELLAPVAKNGESNNARPVAVAAMCILATGLIVFWYKVPVIFHDKKTLNTTIRIGGIGSMLVMPLMLTGIHDPIINAAGMFGVVALISITINFFSHGMTGFGWFTVFCILLCGINNYVYYTGQFTYYLPLIQKFTFISFLSWFAALSVKTYNHQKIRIKN